MKTYTIDDIRGIDPCYDPVTGLSIDGEQVNDGFLSEDWTGTLLDILDVQECPAQDRLWVVLGLLTEREQRLAARAFVRHTPLGDGRTTWDLLTDERSRTAVETSERYGRGEAQFWELDAARDAARDAALDVAWAAAWAAAWADARAAAWAAAWAAALDVAWAAAWDAALDAAWAAAWDAALDAARKAQVEILREMLADKH